MVKSQLIPPFQNLFQTPSKLLNQHQNLHVASLNPLCWMVKSHDSCCLNPLFFMVFCPYFFVDKNSSVYVIPHFCCLNSPFFCGPQLPSSTPKHRGHRGSPGASQLSSRSARATAEAARPGSMWPSTPPPPMPLVGANCS
jgi:hypothetical protein